MIYVTTYITKHRNKVLNTPIIYKINKNEDLFIE